MQGIEWEGCVWRYSCRGAVSSGRSAGAPVLNVFGGKITTYRRLAESALDKISSVLPAGKGNRTAGVPLPGGDFPHDDVERLINELVTAYPFLTQRWARRLRLRM